MSKRRCAVFVLLLVISGFIGASAAVMSDIAPGKWERFDTGNGFSVQLPSGWSFLNNGKDGEVVTTIQGPVHDMTLEISLIGIDKVNATSEELQSLVLDIQDQLKFSTGGRTPGVYTYKSGPSVIFGGSLENKKSVQVDLQSEKRKIIKAITYYDTFETYKNYTDIGYLINSVQVTDEPSNISQSPNVSSEGT